MRRIDSLADATHPLVAPASKPVQRVDRDRDVHEIPLGHRHEDVQVTLDHRVLGDDGARVIPLVQQCEGHTRQSPLLFDGLIGIRVAADVGRLADVASFGEFA